jgi:hypothetical protein
MDMDDMGDEDTVWAVERALRQQGMVVRDDLAAAIQASLTAPETVVTACEHCDGRGWR